VSAPFDLLVRGGEVVGAGPGLDVGVRDGLVGAIGPQLPADGAAQVIDADGLLVAPGLVDLHTHVLHGLTLWGVDPGAWAPRSGVTTWVDAGSAGAYMIDGARRFILDAAPVRVLAFLNISSIGLVGPSWELSHPGYLDEELCADAARAHADVIVGMKARIDRHTVGTLGLAPLDAALRVAERCALPLMVHIAEGPPEIDDVLDRLRPGDIVTHCATGRSMRLVDDERRVRPSVRRALGRGVVLDLGHGSGGFSFTVAEALLDAGVALPICSSDAHQYSVNGPMFDLPTCLTKLLALGVSLDDALRSATSAPAAAIGRPELGALRVGGPADLALLAVDDDALIVQDTQGETRTAPARVRAVTTIAGGRVLDPGPIAPPARWVPLSPAQRAAREALARGEDVDLAATLEPTDLVAPPLAGSGQDSAAATQSSAAAGANP
jgi:dihydroorotase